MGVKGHNVIYMFLYIYLFIYIVIYLFLNVNCYRKYCVLITYLVTGCWCCLWRNKSQVISIADNLHWCCNNYWRIHMCFDYQWMLILIVETCEDSLEFLDPSLYLRHLRKMLWTSKTKFHLFKMAKFAQQLNKALCPHYISSSSSWLLNVFNIPLLKN